MISSLMVGSALSQSILPPPQELPHSFEVELTQSGPGERSIVGNCSNTSWNMPQKVKMNITINHVVGCDVTNYSGPAKVTLEAMNGEIVRSVPINASVVSSGENGVTIFNSVFHDVPWHPYYRVKVCIYPANPCTLPGISSVKANVYVGPDTLLP